MNPLLILMALVVHMYPVVAFHIFVHPWIRYALSDITVSVQVLSKFLAKASSLSFSTLLAHHIMLVAVTCIYRCTKFAQSTSSGISDAQPTMLLYCIVSHASDVFHKLSISRISDLAFSCAVHTFFNTDCYPRLCLHTHDGFVTSNPVACHVLD